MAPSTQKVRPGAESFWEFVRLRQQAWHARFVGKRPAPYSDDPAIARHHFTNVYRELDKGTVYFQNQLPEKATLRAVLLRSLAYRPVNRVATFESFGAVPAGIAAREQFFWHCSRRMEDGERAFTGRHQTRGLKNYRRTLDDISVYGDKVAREVAAAPDMPAAMKALRQVWGIGDFMGWQVLCDLLESSCLEHLPDNLRWAHLGPGAMGGLRLIFDAESVCRATSVAMARSLVADKRNDTAPFAPPGLPRRLDIKNVEHALCEYTRWVACRNGGTHGLEVKEWAKARRAA